MEEIIRLFSTALVRSLLSLTMFRITSQERRLLSDYNSADTNCDGTGDTQSVIDDGNVGQYFLMTLFNLISERLNKIPTRKTFI